MPRLSRFKRIPHIVPIQLTERDRAIIRLVAEHRFLNSRQVVALLGQNPQPILRRLQRLYHHGYLERPRAQLDYYHRGGSRPIVYGLGNKGLTALGVRRRTSDGRWGEKNRAVGRIFLEHALLVSQIMVSFELACRAQSQVRFIPREELARSHPIVASLRWRVNLSRHLKLGVLPDAVFALEFLDAHGRCDRAFFFLEADRGTMPIVRRTLSQTSIRRKLLAYRATWLGSVPQKRFGFHRFRVLMVTKSAARLDRLVEACRGLKSGRGLFLFAHRDEFQNAFDILARIWRTTFGAEAVSLLPSLPETTNLHV